MWYHVIDGILTIGCVLLVFLWIQIADNYKRKYKETLGQFCVLQAEKGRVDTALKARETAYKKLEEYVKRLEDDTALKATRIEELRSNCDTKDQYISKLKIEHQERIDKDTQSLATTLSENIVLNKYKEHYEENVKVLESKDRVIANLDQRVFNLEKEIASRDTTSSALYKRQQDVVNSQEKQIDTLSAQITKLEETLKFTREELTKISDQYDAKCSEVEELEGKVVWLANTLDGIETSISHTKKSYGTLKQYPSTLPALGNAVGGSTNEIVTPRSCSMTPEEKREFIRQVNKVSEGKNVFTLKNEGEIND